MLREERIEERRRRILAGIVKTYIETAMPVASRILVYKYRLRLSPATVRNVMAELEKLGYLTHPHTSAGRIPTYKGYRYYVEMIMEEEQLTPSEKKKILLQLINTQWDEIETLLTQALQLVSDYTNQVGILLYKRANNICIEKIDMVYINNHKLLFIIITDSGDVIHLFLEGEDLPEVEKFDKILSLLNRALKGESLGDIEYKIKENLISSSNPLYNAFLPLFNALMETLGNVTRREFFYQGTNKIIDYPEFQESGTLHRIIDMLERKVDLIKILESDLEGSDINIHIGAEIPYRYVQECSIITAKYKLKGKPLGTIGILGPTRLPYGRTISVIKYIAEVLGQTIESAIF